MNKNKTCWILDTETTGFDPETGDRLVELGAIEVDENKKPTGRQIHEYVDPEREIPQAATRIHKLTRDDCIQLGNGQKFRDIAEDFYKKVYGSEIVIHNAAFDTKFINHELELLNRAGYKFKLNPEDTEYSTFKPIDEVCTVICSLKVASGRFPGMRNNLDILCKRFGISNAHREFHGALLDSGLLLQVWALLTQHQKIMEFNAAPVDQDVNKLADRLNTKFEVPVYSDDTIDDDQHKKIMGRVVKESGGASLWM
jgi:DNA polymerase-3 subunit epsilon